jgi:ketosteroid isomerase-like protein
MEDRVAALEEAVRRFGEAWARGDVAVLDSLLAPTYTHADASGAFLDRAAWLAYAAKRTGRSTQVEFDDLRIRIVGDIGIATGINRLHGPGIRNAGDTKDAALRFTQLWIFQNGRWLREAFQATPIVAETGQFS